MKDASLDDSSVFEKEAYSNFVTKYDKQVQNFSIFHFQEFLPEAHYLAEEDEKQKN